MAVNESLQKGYSSNGVEISISRLNKGFKGHHVLKDIDLNIMKGKTTVIIGASGAGKSLLLRHMIGLEQPDSGKIIIQGQDIAKAIEKDLIEIRKRFAMVFQSAALLNSITVGENVGLGLKEQRRFTNKEIDDIVVEKLRLVGLEAKKDAMPGTLSGGMKKRAGIARALAMDPEIVLFDEPTAGLDPIMAGNIDELILELKGRLKMTSVVVTHDMESAFYIGDRICMLHEGRIITDGAPEELKKSSNKILQQFISRHIN